MSVHRFSVKVYIEDTDYAGVVYHSNYLKYFERARSEWYEERGLGLMDQMAAGIFLPVRSLSIDYLNPARLNDNLDVLTVLKKQGKASLVFLQELRLSRAADTLLCRAEVKIGCIDQTRKPRAFPIMPTLEVVC